MEPKELNGKGYLGLIDKVRVEDVELVPLYHFWRWIIDIVVGLVVEVPIVAHLHSIEVLWSFGFLFLAPSRLVGGDHLIEVHLILLKRF